MSAEKTAQNNPIIPLKGRILSIRQIDRKDNPPMFETVINTPASDPYSHPNKFCVLSEFRLGAKDADIAIQAEVQCRPWKDNTGQWRYPHILRAV